MEDLLIVLSFPWVAAYLLGVLPLLGIEISSWLYSKLAIIGFTWGIVWTFYYPVISITFTAILISAGISEPLGAFFKKEVVVSFTILSYYLEVSNALVLGLFFMSGIALEFAFIVAWFFGSSSLLSDGAMLSFCLSAPVLWLPLCALYDFFFPGRTATMR